MRKEKLKRLLNLKLELIEALIEDMPVPVQTTMLQIEHELISALHEVTSAYLESHPETEQEKTDTGIHPINID